MKRPDYYSYLFIDKEEFYSVYGRIQESNKSTLGLITVVTAVVLAVMFVVSAFVPTFAANRYVYLGIGAVSVILNFLSKRINKEKIIHLCYIYVASMMLLGIFIGVITNPNENATTYMVLEIAIPLLFIDRPVRMNFTFAFFTILLIIACVLYKDPNFMTTDITNGIVFVFVGMVLNCYMGNFRVRSLVYEKQVRMLSEFDLLTGLKNRNTYEKDIRTLAKKDFENVICVYLDVNGLHELNNTKGHHAGDKMLKMIAKCFQDEFGVESTYRLGGDEYLAFVFDGDLKSVDNASKLIHIECEKNDYYISIGYNMQSKKNLDIKALVSGAEMFMYQEKSAYYKAKGSEREVRM